MVRIEHVAVWTTDLDRLKKFYETYFGATAGPRYDNRARSFSSYFLTFAGGSRLELMSCPGLEPGRLSQSQHRVGYVHLALSVGSEAGVDALTERLARDGVKVVSGPRRTGDGYYESVVNDPDGNLVEITA
jgi:lactoylglutathione lyase